MDKLKAYHYNWFIRLSVVTHVLAIGLLFVPDGWIYAAIMVLANHAVLTAQGLWPRSQWLGRNVSQVSPGIANNAVYITIDDGPCPKITPQVLEILAQYNAKATFFCIGKKVTQHPDLVKQISAAGHRVENHSMTHSHQFSLWGTKKISEDIQAAQTAITNATHTRPRYFRAPAGLRNIFLDFVLQKLGLRLISWTRRGFDTRQNNPKKVLHALCNNLRAGDILLLHDANAAITPQGRPVILDVLPLLLQNIQRQTLHAQCLPDHL